MDFGNFDYIKKDDVVLLLKTFSNITSVSKTKEGYSLSLQNHNGYVYLSVEIESGKIKNITLKNAESL